MLSLIKEFVYYDMDGEMRVSSLAVEQLIYEMSCFDDIRKELAVDEYAWGKRQVSWFQKNVDEVTMLEENIMEETKGKILMWIEGMLSKEAVPKEEIKAWINEDTIACWIRVLLSKSCKEISVEALNKALKAERMEYQVKAVGRQENNNSQIQIYKFVKELMEQEN